MIMNKVLCSKLAGASYKNNRLNLSSSIIKKILCVIFLLISFAGVSHADNGLNITASIFPIYDWVREISKGSDVKVSLLLDKGIDLHSYNPTVNDIIEIARSDVFIYVGGESDEWAHDALKNVTNDKQIAINLIEILGSNVKLEEELEGMQLDHDDEEAEADEHIWLSLRNAEIICRYICEKLTELDSEYQEVINSSARKILLFGDRFPFRYLADDYGLKCYAAFSGCSAESEASFETVKFLAEKVDELNLPCVITIEGTRHKIAQTVINSTKAKDQKIFVLNSMQSATHDEASYLSIMRANLEVLKSALN